MEELTGSTVIKYYLLCYQQLFIFIWNTEESKSYQIKSNQAIYFISNIVAINYILLFYIYLKHENNRKLLL